MALQISSGPAEVLANGQVTTFAGNPLTLEWSDELRTLVVHLTFGTDPSVEDVAVDSQTIPNGWHLHCINFDDDQGRGSSIPVLLGGHGDDAYYLHFRVFKWGRTDDRTVHYTFYRVPGAIVHDGEDE